MATKTLKEISVELAKKQPLQVNYLTEEAPIIDSMPFEEASHGLWNAYEEVTEINGPSLVKMDAPLSAIDVDTELKKVDLDLFGGIIERGEDAIQQFGGMGAYLAKKEQSIFSKFGMDAEKHVLYNRLRAFVIKNGEANKKLLYKGTGSSNQNYSIIAVRYEPGTTCGLYNPKGFGQGAMLNFSPINGGSIYKNSNGVLVYGGRYKSHLGVQMASPKTIGALVNIDITADFATEASRELIATKIDDMLSDIRATDAYTQLFMHQKVLNRLFKYKVAALQMDPANKKYDRQVASWNGVPVVTSYNFLDGTEQNV